MGIFNSRMINEGYATDEELFDAIPDVDTSNVNDNITEAVSDIIYANERNWNMLMKTVGIAELSCVEAAGDVIYESADIKAFFKKIGDFFKGILNKIAALFKKIVEKVQNWFWKIRRSINDKKFKDLISVPSGFEYEGYTFIDGMDKFVVSEKTLDELFKMMESVDFDFSVPPTEEDEKIAKEFEAIESEEWLCAFINDTIGTNIQKRYDISKALFMYFRDGKEKPAKITAADINLSNYKYCVNNNVTTIKRAVGNNYKKCEAHTNKLLNEIRKTAKDTSGLESKYGKKWASLEVRYLNAVTKQGKTYLDGLTQIYSAQLKALTDQSKQYYSALMKMLSKQSDDEKESKTESFGFSHNILDSISFT